MEWDCMLIVQWQCLFIIFFLLCVNKENGHMDINDESIHDYLFVSTLYFIYVHMRTFIDYFACMSRI